MRCYGHEWTDTHLTGGCMDNRLDEYRRSDVESPSTTATGAIYSLRYGSASCQPPLFSSTYRPENRTFNTVIPLLLGFVHILNFVGSWILWVFLERSGSPTSPSIPHTLPYSELWNFLQEMNLATDTVFRR